MQQRSRLAEIPMNLKQLLLHREYLEKIHRETIALINARIAKAIRKRKVHCASCGFRGTISDWTFVQTFFFPSQAEFYLEQWHKQPTEACLVTCPQCGVTVTVAAHLYRNEFIETMEEKDVPPERLFKKVRAKYGEQAIEDVESKHD